MRTSSSAVTTRRRRQSSPPSQSAPWKAAPTVDGPSEGASVLGGGEEEGRAVVPPLEGRLVEGRAVAAGGPGVARWPAPPPPAPLNVTRRYKVSSGIKVTGLP